MTDINPLIYPMTSAKVKSGVVKDMTFDAVADNEGGSVKMLFLYNDLYVELMKEHDGKPEERSFLDKLINSILKHNNPSIGRDGKPKEPRSGDLTFVRNPYHSSFNYFWQILRPALEQSVGVSKKLQDEMAEASGFLAKLKNFFKRKKPNENKKQNEEEEEDGFILQVAPSVSTQ